MRTVFATHYKNWKKFLNEAGYNSDFFGGSRKIIGNGGIIAITTMRNQSKESVPVKYK